MNIGGKKEQTELHRIFQDISGKVNTLDKNNKVTRGHTLKLSKMKCTRDYWKYFFSNRVVNRWNMLAQQIVGATSLKAFKMAWIS